MSFELDDCGREVMLTVSWNRAANRTINMVIKAPRGIMVLFEDPYISIDSQCKAVKAFMEAHKND